MRANHLAHSLYAINPRLLIMCTPDVVHVMNEWNHCKNGELEMAAVLEAEGLQRYFGTELGISLI